MNKISNLTALNSLPSKTQDSRCIPQITAFGLLFITSPCSEIATQILALSVLSKQSLANYYHSDRFQSRFLLLSSQIHHYTFSPRLPDGPVSPGKPADPYTKSKQTFICTMSILVHGWQLPSNRAQHISSSQRTTRLFVQVLLWGGEDSTKSPGLQCMQEHHCIQTHQQ